MRKNTNSNQIREHGAVQLAAVADYTFLVLIALAGILLTVNLGLILHYKQKLDIATDIAARFAGAHASSPTVIADTKQLVSDVYLRMGLPGLPDVAEPNMQLQLNGRSAVAITVSMTAPLFSPLSILPKSITLKDTGLALQIPVASYLGIAGCETDASYTNLLAVLWVPILQSHRLKADPLQHVLKVKPSWEWTNGGPPQIPGGKNWGGKSSCSIDMQWGGTCYAQPLTNITKPNADTDSGPTYNYAFTN